MNIAKPTEEDFEAAFSLIRLLGCVNDGFFPIIEQHECEDSEEFYSDEPEHLQRFFNMTMELLENNPGSLERVIYGMAVLHDNNVFSPTDDHLALHPRFIEQQTEGDL